MMEKVTLKRLFEPINIGTMRVKNRIVMPAMGTGFASREGLVTQRTKDYYEARARGGVGMVIVECTCVDFPRGIHALNRLVIHNDSSLPGLTELACVIKKHSARAILQLNHAGKMAKSRITGLQPVAPSPFPFRAGASPEGETPKELTTEEITVIVELFAGAATHAKKAGFDGVELHSAHGYLLGQFLSPVSNQRHDRYGGSLENRARMLLEVLGAIRKRVGDDYPLWCRINGREFGADNSLTLDDAQALARLVNGMVDAIHVSAWGYGNSSLANYPDVPGALVPLAAEIKKVVTVPVIAVGRLSPEVGEKALEEGKADLIALGRELIADPEIPNKTLSGRLEDIRPCIACFHCHDAGLLSDSSIECSVNASAGRERELEIKPAIDVKMIAIVGGGPAGMEAARILSLRGHKVVLFEKEPQLGGQLNAAAIPPYKQRIRPLVTYLSTQLQKLNVDIRLNTEADLEAIRRFNPDIVILALGASPIVPPIPGAGLDNVVTAQDILTGRAEAGQNVVIIGGGSTGCETAEFLVEKGRKVTIIEMLPKLAADMGYKDRLRLLLRINSLPIVILTSTKCTRIQQDGAIVITEQGKERLETAQTVVLALGMKPNDSLLALLNAEGFETRLAGDCRQGGRIVDAIGDGLRLGCIL